ncbi:LysR family transcriptional regulator [uncultured Shewanella sp.]|uniref:LysR family transcriptional regulator n=1 Tax=uncultured Shewanella sp. TaxID=173975 RepID=UPI002638F8CF|nr:LysR family transcriptional regulator [uncultured Shewanella sp.]
MINLIWLNTFCTLVEVQHFTRTANRLFMTQSGVSQHVRKLEEQLQQNLLIRQGKQFTLTYAGESLYQSGRKILNDVFDIEQKISSDPDDAGEIRIMSPGSVGLKLYPRVLELQQTSPKLVMDYRFAPNATIEAAIINFEADIGLMTSLTDAVEVNAIAIGNEALVLVTPSTVLIPDWEVLFKLGFIDHPDGEHHVNQLLGANFSAFQGYDSLIKKGFSNQIHLILKPVSMGLGFTVLPYFAVDDFINTHLIKVHQLPKPVKEVIYLCHHKNRPLLNRMKKLVAHVKSWM